MVDGVGPMAAGTSGEVPDQSDGKPPHGGDGGGHVTLGADRRTLGVDDRREGEAPGQAWGEPKPRGKHPAKGDQEAVGRDAQAGMVVEAAPSPALVLPQAKFLLEILIIPFDAPAQLG